jgi:hypothetical protein
VRGEPDNDDDPRPRMTPNGAALGTHQLDIPRL